MAARKGGRKAPPPLHPPPLPDMCKPDDVVKGRWKIIEKIGAGGFGQVYSATYGKRTVAIKCESVDVPKQLIKTEVAVLKEMRGEACVVKFYGSGKTETFCFMVMGLVGKSLSAVRKLRPKQRFSIFSVCEIGIQTLGAIRCLHEHGVIHRDVKPSNFAIGVNSYDQHRIFILDFGLSRIYRTSDNKVRTPRAIAGFRGTTRYASLNAHRCLELGRSDDLWSYFYMLVELATGALPWRHLKEKKEVAAMKHKFGGVETQQKLPGIRSGSTLEVSFNTILSEIAKLQYADDPNYSKIEGVLNRMQTSIRATTPEVSLDWVTAAAHAPPLNVDKTIITNHDRHGVDHKNRSKTKLHSNPKTKTDSPVKDTTDSLVKGKTNGPVNTKTDSLVKGKLNGHGNGKRTPNAKNSNNTTRGSDKNTHKSKHKEEKVKAALKTKPTESNAVTHGGGNDTTGPVNAKNISLAKGKTSGSFKDTKNTTTTTNNKMNMNANTHMNTNTNTNGHTTTSTHRTPTQKNMSTTSADAHTKMTMLTASIKHADVSTTKARAHKSTSSNQGHLQSETTTATHQQSRQQRRQQQTKPQQHKHQQQQSQQPPSPSQSKHHSHHRHRHEHNHHQHGHHHDNHHHHNEHTNRHHHNQHNNHHQHNQHKNDGHGRVVEHNAFAQVVLSPTPPSPPPSPSPSLSSPSPLPPSQPTITTTLQTPLPTTTTTTRSTRSKVKESEIVKAKSNEKAKTHTAITNRGNTVVLDANANGDTNDEHADDDYDHKNDFDDDGVLGDSRVAMMMTMTRESPNPLDTARIEFDDDDDDGDDDLMLTRGQPPTSLAHLSLFDITIDNNNNNNNNNNFVDNVDNNNNNYYYNNNNNDNNNSNDNMDSIWDGLSITDDDNNNGNNHTRSRNNNNNNNNNNINNNRSNINNNNNNNGDNNSNNNDNNVMEYDYEYEYEDDFDEEEDDDDDDNDEEEEEEDDDDIHHHDGVDNNSNNNNNNNNTTIYRARITEEERFANDDLSESHQDQLDINTVLSSSSLSASVSLSSSLSASLSHPRSFSQSCMLQLNKHSLFEMHGASSSITQSTKDADVSVLSDTSQHKKFSSSLTSFSVVHNELSSHPEIQIETSQLQPQMFDLHTQMLDPHAQILQHSQQRHSGINQLSTNQHDTLSSVHDDRNHTLAAPNINMNQNGNGNRNINQNQNQNRTQTQNRNGNLTPSLNRNENGKGNRFGNGVGHGEFETRNDDEEVGNRNRPPPLSTLARPPSVLARRTHVAVAPPSTFPTRSQRENPRKQRLLVPAPPPKPASTVQQNDPRKHRFRAFVATTGHQDR